MHVPAILKLCSQVPPSSRLFGQVQENSQGLPDGRLVSCFHECSRTLDKIVGIDCGLSGSTGIVALLATHNLTVANVGDSRCVLGELFDMIIFCDNGVMSLFS